MTDRPSNQQTNRPTDRPTDQPTDGHEGSRGSYISFHVYDTYCTTLTLYLQKETIEIPAMSSRVLVNGYFLQLPLRIVAVFSESEREKANVLERE